MSLAVRGDKDAIALLQGPPFPPNLYYLFEWFGELLIWCDGKPTWRDIQPWVSTMKHAPTPWEHRRLRQISDAFFASQVTTDGN